MTYDSFIAPRLTANGLVELSDNEKQSILIDRQSFTAPIDYQAIALTLETAFLQLIPSHASGSYLTGSVKSVVWGAKSSVTEAIKAGAMVDAKDIIESLALPTEMQTDQQALVTQLTALIGS